MSHKAAPHGRELFPLVTCEFAECSRYLGEFRNQLGRAGRSGGKSDASAQLSEGAVDFTNIVRLRGETPCPGHTGEAGSRYSRIFCC
jgi:hypothetical protein